MVEKAHTSPPFFQRFSISSDDEKICTHRFPPNWKNVYKLVKDLNTTYYFPQLVWENHWKEWITCYPSSYPLFHSISSS